MHHYEINFKCDRCKKDYISRFRVEQELDERELGRLTERLKSDHKRLEHTQCFSCGKKILPGEGRVRIVGRQDPSQEDEKKGVVFTMLTGIFCRDCNRKINTSESH